MICFFKGVEIVQQQIVCNKNAVFRNGFQLKIGECVRACGKVVLGIYLLITPTQNSFLLKRFMQKITQNHWEILSFPFNDLSYILSKSTLFR